jgi:hypothetical protein
MLAVAEPPDAAADEGEEDEDNGEGAQDRAVRDYASLRRTTLPIIYSDPVQIHLLALNPDVGLIHGPGVVGQLGVPMQSVLPFRGPNAGPNATL